MRLKLAEGLTLPLETVTEKLAWLGRTGGGKTYGEDEPRIGTATRWKGKRLLTKAEKLERQRAYARKWRAENREKMRQYFAAYRAAHPEIKISQAQYYRKHIDKWKARPREDKAKRRARAAGQRQHLNESRREWRRKNIDRAKEIERRSRDRRQEQKRAADREYRRAHPDAYKASIARAKAAKPDLYRGHGVKSALTRRARKRNLTVERVSLRRVVAKSHGHCHLCDQPVARADRSFDHLIPIVREGAHAEWNLAVAHLSCNKRRGVRQILPTETREAAEAYIDAYIQRMKARGIIELSGRGMVRAAGDLF